MNPVTNVYEIEEEITKRASLCPKNLVCLTGKGGLHCKVTPLRKGTGDEAFLVDCLVDCIKNAKCPYLKQFEGTTCVCRCPVRREIYKRYGV